MTEADVNYKAVIEEQRHVTGHITTLCRYIGFGLVAIVYAILTSKSAFATEAVGANKALLLFIGGTGCVIVLVDYLQFLFGYISVRAALGNESNKYRYDDHSWSWNARSALFVVKQIVSVVGALLLIGFIYCEATN